MGADLAIVNARIRTLDPRRPFASAVAVKDGTIVALDEDVDAAAAIDARGQALIPGLTDSHIHPFWGAELARGTDLSRCTTPAAVLAALAASGPGGAWAF